MLKKINMSKVVKPKAMFFLMLTLIVSLATAGAVMAIAVPVAGDFAFNVYDIAVNDILSGAIGFVSGCFCVVAGVALAVQNKYIPAIATCICAAVLLGADDLIVSMGMLF